MAVIAISTAAGLFLTFAGWKQTGRLEGLGQMILGLVCLLIALYVYNKPFQDKH